MRILKRNQIIILVMSVMLITAGYVNFTKNQENLMTSVIGDRSDEAIGDAELVSTVPIENEMEVVENLLNPEEHIKNQSEESKEKQEEIETSKEPIKTEEDYYFTTSKLERNTMYSELLETYQEMYNNTNATTEAKKEALENINNINNTKNAIMIAENLIIAKGFEDVVIFSNEDSISVVIKSEELKPEQVAQIQNIVSREIKVDTQKIHISNK